MTRTGFARIIKIGSKNMGKPDWYHIHIQGHLDSQWADYFEAMTLTHNPDGTTILAGPVVDSTALYGLLDKLRDLGLRLISVQHVKPEDEA
jgi:hypothetical protein